MIYRSTRTTRRICRMIRAVRENILRLYAILVLLVFTTITLVTIAGSTVRAEADQVFEIEVNENSFNKYGVPIAGTTMELAKILDDVNTLNVDKNKVTSVATPIEEEDVIEEENTEEEVSEDLAEEEIIEDVVEPENNEEDEYNAKLEAYFGYVPDSWELAYWKACVMAEVGYNQPDEGVRAVADCIGYVRCNIDDRFPNTIYRVITDTNQFETWSNGSVEAMLGHVSDQVKRICEEQIQNGPSYDYAFFTAGMYNEYCIPATVIGDHYFGY